jgi:hypothetical protein
MKDFWKLIIAALLLGIVIVVWWMCGNLDAYGLESQFNFLFGSNRNWLLLLSGMPVAGILGYMLRTYHEETVKTADRENIALQIAILQNQEKRIASLLKEKKEFDLQYNDIQEREARLVEDEKYIAKAKGWERDLETARKTSKRYKDEIDGLKKGWKNPSNKSSIKE